MRLFLDRADQVGDQIGRVHALVIRTGGVVDRMHQLGHDLFDLLGDESMRLHIANEARKLGEVHRNCSIAAVVEKAADGVVR